MAYGELKVDSITFTDGGSDTTVSVSGLVRNPTFSNFTVTGTISGSVVRGGTTVSGATVTGTTANFTTANFVSGVFTTQVSGATVTGDAGNFTTGTFGTIVAGNTTPTTGVTIDVSGTYVGNVADVSALNVDCTSGNYFIKTITGNSTFTVSNVPASGKSYGFTLEVTHTSGTITWFSGVEWPASIAPDLSAGKTHLFVFITDDGGTRWRGASLVDYVN